MKERNIQFMDLYKTVERFLKDAYLYEKPVTDYITAMETQAAEGRRNVASWDGDYKMLKHLRWIRNQLAHEVAYDTDIVTEDDYKWLSGFDGRLRNGTDPLGTRYSIRKRAALTAAAKQKAGATKTAGKGNPSAKTAAHHTGKAKTGPADEEGELTLLTEISPRPVKPKRPTFWQRVRRFLGW